jgi:hypothetical protein
VKIAIFKKMHFFIYFLGILGIPESRECLKILPGNPETTNTRNTRHHKQTTKQGEIRIVKNQFAKVRKF